MKQIIQSLKDGNTKLIDVPTPSLKPGHVLIHTTQTLVSLGTEKMLVKFGKSTLIEKIKKRPDQVKKAFQRMKSDGIISTINLVKEKLDQEFPLGYCNVGRVIESAVDGIVTGDRVASNGNHSEIVLVPENLIVKIPDNVSDDEASFTVIGSIGLQGIRLIKPEFGENIVVIGLGLVGLITVQLLKSNGINVIGVDIDKRKCELAKSYGAITINSSKKDPVKSIKSIIGEDGVDGVLITASADTNAIISQAAQMSRKRGRIVLVGVVGLNIDRNDFYEKELSFQVSCSYGPGRYDSEYEVKGIDYPLPYVRWTEKRNFETVIGALEKKSLIVDDLITEKIPIEDYDKVYHSLGDDGSIASIFTYSQNIGYDDVIICNNKQLGIDEGNIGIIGSGNFTKTTILPILKKLKANIKYISSSGGISSTQLASKYGIQHSTTNFKKVLRDDKVDSVIIATRHDNHHELILESLKAKKQIFVEKPLCIYENQLDQIIRQYKKSKDSSIMIGFNRRFSSHSKAIKDSIGDNSGPINIIYTMNAGHIPKNHWVHDKDIGGGRIIGEACHAIDLCNFFTESKIKSICVNSLGEIENNKNDNVSILLRYNNGSNAIVNYFSNGSNKYSKERFEIFANDRTWICDNYSKTIAYDVPRFKTLKTKVDKGHLQQFKLYMKKLKNGGDPLISFDDIINVTKATFAVSKSIKKGVWIDIK